MRGAKRTVRGRFARLRIPWRTWFHLPMPWDFWLIFLVLGILLPWRGHQRARALMALPEVTSRNRIKLYVATILFQWMLTVLVAWRALDRGLSWHDLGVESAWDFSLLTATAGGALLIAVGHWANVRRMAHSEHPNVVRLRALGARLFPRSAAEVALYAALALTAGLCEEFLFRGFVMAALFRAGLAAWAVVLLSSAMFGVAHLYQGKGGAAGTGILGTIFALVRLLYQNLLPPVVWHAVLDVVAGIAGTRYLVGKVDQAASDEVPSEIHR
jgi:membrane protease YdiL (CAAX protease family)